MSAGVTGPEDREQRQAELAASLAGLTARIAAACAAAGRDESEITLIAVTKTRPAADVLALAALGLADFGENRDQEAAAKAARVAAALTQNGQPSRLTWHFIGQLQTNKAASVVGYADVVHSVDRVRLVRALGTAARQARAARGERPLTGLVQVSLDGDPARGGVPLGAFSQIAEAIEAEEGLLLGGVMAVAPVGRPAREAFAPLREISARARAVSPAATMVSAGMSDDLEAAIQLGATHLRIGTALLGNRRPPVL